MKSARHIILNAIILISILFPSSKVLGQTDLELKQHLINGISSFEENMNEDARINGFCETTFFDAANSFSNGSTLENYEDIAAYNLGRSLMETEDLEGAASAFKQAIASSENNQLISNAWYNSGNIALNSDDPSTAIEAYKSSLRLNPDFANARHNLAIANKMLQQQEEQEEQEQDGDEENEDEKEGDEENEDEKEGDEENEDEKEGDEENEDEKEGDEENEDEKEGDEENEDKKDGDEENEDEKEGDQEDKDEQEKQVAGQISKEEMARILESLDQEEERILSKLRMQKGDGKKKTIVKPW
jgi:Ca-activated chloride channel family protein